MCQWCMAACRQRRTEQPPAPASRWARRTGPRSECPSLPVASARSCTPTTPSPRPCTSTTGQLLLPLKGASVCEIQHTYASNCCRQPWEFPGNPSKHILPSCPSGFRFEGDYAELGAKQGFGRGKGRGAGRSCYIKNCTLLGTHSRVAVDPTLFVGSIV